MDGRESVVSSLSSGEKRELGKQKHHASFYYSTIGLSDSEDDNKGKT